MMPTDALFIIAVSALFAGVLGFLAGCSTSSYYRRIGDALGGSMMGPMGGPSGGRPGGDDGDDEPPGPTGPTPAPTSPGSCGDVPADRFAESARLAAQAHREAKGRAPQAMLITLRGEFPVFATFNQPASDAAIAVLAAHVALEAFPQHTVRRVFPCQKRGQRFARPVPPLKRWPGRRDGDSRGEREGGAS